MSKRVPGQPGRFITWFRSALMGRPLEPHPWTRTTAVMSSRSPPPPKIPEGPAHRLANNYYVSRDDRRRVTPPQVLSTHKQLREGSDQLSSGDVTFPQMTTPPTPGLVQDPQWREIPPS
ncbi:NADH dehydrogenase [ubiquinone] 1 alpha subcomplex subunit 7-like [Halichondria panicea]|uniref:NADH dehydrogenase [ubiquinone] 1 alpha subcomplex subunit 7-like n=1 Tax=Halichondria panicea TaxID=6063 RepID=UPI00312BB760